jgi:hypothetical protein
MAITPDRVREIFKGLKNGNGAPKWAAGIAMS